MAISGLGSGAQTAPIPMMPIERLSSLFKLRHRRHLTNVEEIAAVPGVDALFVGPGDLGLRLSQREGEAQIGLDKAIAQVADAARRHGIAWGIPAGTPELIKQHRGMGAQLLAYGGDFSLTAVLENNSQDFGEALGE